MRIYSIFTVIFTSSFLCLFHALCEPINGSRVMFKIALFADLHFGEAESADWGPMQDKNSTRVMNFVLDQQKPDFVVYLGDLLTANNMLEPNASSYWEEAVSPTLKKGIAWASVFGNHDDMAFEWPLEWFSSVNGIPGGNEIEEYFSGTTRAALMANEVHHDLSKSMGGPKSLWPSVSNFVLELKSNVTTIWLCKPQFCDNSTSTVSFLYFLDSGGGSYPEIISTAQVKWLGEMTEQLNPDQSIPELAFWHIPTQEYECIAPHAESSIKDPCVGSLNAEPVAPQVAELGLMDLLSRRVSMKASFVGHNHGLDWCCPYRSMFLCFARHSGYGGYGHWIRGARIIELELAEDVKKVYEPFSLKKEPSTRGINISTYIYLEDGSTTSWMALN